MARNLYRFYLYAVFIAMLILAAVGLGSLLQPLLGLTPLHGTDLYNPPPANADIVRGVVFFVVSWVIAGLLGGSHYWLIRRDMKGDPQAGNNPIRSFFLNIAELVVVPIAVFALATFWQQLGQTTSDLSGLAAFAIATLALFATLEVERQRAQASTGASIVFQRLHLYGVQLILLIILTFYWLDAGSKLLNTIAFGGKAFCSGSFPPDVLCQAPGPLSSIGAAAWIVLFWIGYGLVARSDTSSLLRRILHFLSFAYGMGFILFGINRGIELGLLALQGVSKSPAEIVNEYNFPAYIAFGVVIVVVYGFWLRMAARQQPAGMAMTVLIGEAITTGLLAGAFWWGIGFVLRNLLLLPVPSADWASALALVITGLAYIPLDYHLHRRKTQDEAVATDPRRGYVFALLGGGILAAAIGGALALYALLSAALGSPLPSSDTILKSGAAAFIVGVLVVGIYLWIANRESIFHGVLRHAPRPEPVAPPAEPSTIEEVLDELLAGKISRDEAARRIRDITHPEIAQQA